MKMAGATGAAGFAISGQGNDGRVRSTGALRPEGTTSRLWRGLWRVLLSANAAALIRCFRYGPMDAVRRLAGAAYRAVDPFGGEIVLPAEVVISNRNLRSIPEVSLRSVINGCPLIQVDGTHSYVDGSLNWPDLAVLLTILVDRRPRVALEVGTFNGATTRLMAINLAGSIIHTIDLPKDYSVASDSAELPKDDFHLINARGFSIDYLSDPEISNIVQHFGDTAHWDFATARGAEFFFIDASHTYEYVRNDTEKAMRTCHGRVATFLWHDCDMNHCGVTSWLAEMCRSGYPVKRIAGTNLAVMDWSG